MILDVDTPVVTMLKIVGRLRFKELANPNDELTLSAKHLYVKGSGELFAGTESTPYGNKGKILMFGEKASQYITEEDALEPGHKVIVNTGKIKLFG